MVAGPNAPSIAEITVGDPVEAWEAAGFTVDGDVCRVGQVPLRLVGRANGKRILAWTLRDVPPASVGPDGLDGLPTTVSTDPPPDGAPPSHPNGVRLIDHIVLLTPDQSRTVAALEAAGFDARRTRHTDTYGAPFLQTFFRAGEVIVELIGPEEPSGDGPAQFFGLAYTVDDLDATKALLGDALGEPKDAVQPRAPHRHAAPQGGRVVGGHRLHVPGRRRRLIRSGPRSPPGRMPSTIGGVLDHVFTDAIGALRDAFENALLERQAFEERFQVDVLLGDMTWETSYGLPGEGLPPRVQADITLDWPTWAQTAYRTWYIGEPMDEPPRIEIEIVLRVQRLASSPDPNALLTALPEQSPPIGAERLDRSGPTVETVYPSDLKEPEYAIEVSYEGTYELEEATLADGSVLDDHFGAMGGWISSTLVRVGDLEFDFLPPIDETSFD